MKRYFALAVAVCILLLCSCAANPKCEFDAIHDAMKSAETVQCQVYSENKAYELAGEELYDMVSGKWEKISQPDAFTKILSITVGTQYEIGFFEGGKAIVYSGYAGVFERDRQYYSVELKCEVQDICDFIKANGTEVEIEEQ